MESILVSGCLLGRPIRYDGRPKPLAHALLEQWQAEGRLVPICPELAGGLPVPRPPAEIANGADGSSVLDGQAAVMEKTGGDVTEAFLDGARKALETARLHGCRFALLTEGSPSCGSGFIHDGRFDGSRHQGSGVTAALLRRHGIQVFSEERIGELAAALHATTSFEGAGPGSATA